MLLRVIYLYLGLGLAETCESGECEPWANFLQVALEAKVAEHPWPHARGKTTQRSGFTPEIWSTHHLAWNWTHPEGQYHLMFAGGPVIDSENNIYQMTCTSSRFQAVAFPAGHNPQAQPLSQLLSGAMWCPPLSMLEFGTNREWFRRIFFSLARSKQVCCHFHPSHPWNLEVPSKPLLRSGKVWWVRVRQRFAGLLPVREAFVELLQLHGPQQQRGRALRRSGVGHYGGRAGLCRGCLALGFWTFLTFRSDSDKSYSHKKTCTRTLICKITKIKQIYPKSRTCMSSIQWMSSAR